MKHISWHFLVKFVPTSTRTSNASKQRFRAFNQNFWTLTWRWIEEKNLIWNVQLALRTTRWQTRNDSHNRIAYDSVPVRDLISVHPAWSLSTVCLSRKSVATNIPRSYGEWIHNGLQFSTSDLKMFKNHSNTYNTAALTDNMFYVFKWWLHLKSKHFHPKTDGLIRFFFVDKIYAWLRTETPCITLCLRQ